LLSGSTLLICWLVSKSKSMMGAKLPSPTFSLASVINCLNLVFSSLAFGANSWYLRRVISCWS